MFCFPTMIFVHAGVVNVWQCITHESMNTPLVDELIAGLAALINSYIMVQTAVILSNSVVINIAVTALLESVEVYCIWQNIGGLKLLWFSWFFNVLQQILYSAKL